MNGRRSLREQVEQALPGWETWYPSVFDAAVDLGLIRARVCAPSALLLSSRHVAVQSQAEQAHREQWGGDQEDLASGHTPAGKSRRSRRRRRRR